MKCSLQILASVIAAASLLTGCAQKPHAAASAPAKKYAFWPAPPDAPRIQYLRSFNSSADLRPPRSGMDRIVFGREAPQDRSLAKPYGVAVTNGCIYVCDVRGQSVVVFDLRNQQTRLMGLSGSQRLQRPVDIAIAPDGRKYVADPGRAAVLVFDDQDRFELTLNMTGASPVSVAVHGDRLYVCDQQAQHVKVLDRFLGTQLSTIGGPGGFDGQFLRPTSVRVDAEGNVYVVDIVRPRVQKFAPDGTVLLAFGEAGNRPGFISKPKHLAVAGDGVIYSVDAAFDNVQLFDEEGKVVMYFGSPGAHPGAMNLPAGIAIHEADLDLFAPYVHPSFEIKRLIVVTNQFGPDRVAVYAQGQLRPGAQMADISAVRAVVTGVRPETTGGLLAPNQPHHGAPASDAADGEE